MKEDITLCIGGERITLKVSQRENHQRNRSKTNVSISICNDKIINTTSITKNEESKNYTKDANEEIECTNQVRYIILRKIMHSLFKTCKKKKTMKLIKIKNTYKYQDLGRLSIIKVTIQIK